jgi:ligand-binding sensor domain-containing protein/two-component sensor histidine kinase
MIRRLPLFLYFFLCCTSITAQQYNFHNYSVADGLAQSQVYAMCEDSRGYLWLGTQGGGLSRFDGQQFKNFTEDDSLVNNFVNCITNDLNGNLWIGTSEGVCSYDGTDFKKLSYKGDNSPVNAIHFSKDGKLWIATQNAGLFIFKDRKLESHFNIDNGFISNRILCFYEDNDNSMWIGTDRGLVNIKGKEQTVLGKKEGIRILEIRGITRNGNGDLWIATFGGGLFFREKGSDSFSSFGVEQGLSNNTTQCILTDHLGRIWIGTASGVTRIDGKKVKNFSEHEGLCSNVVFSMMEDSWGNIWFGTSGGGVCMLDGERFIHFNEKSGDMGTWVWAIHCDRKGDMWFGTSSGGVTEYDGMYYTNYYEGAGFTSGKVKAIGEDTSGTMWFGTSGDGAYEYKNGSFRHFQKSDGLSQVYVNAFVSDSLNREWIATSGGGISIYDSRTEKFEHVGTKQGLTDTRINCLAKDNEGRIWAGGREKGIFLLQYDSSGTSVKQVYLKGENVRSATCDRYGNMWFGTVDRGICRFDGNDFKYYTKKEGLASNNIYLLLADRAGNLWVGTEKGLDKISYDASGNISVTKHYGKGEGLIGIETSQNAACLDTATGVWFGTISGASVYHPENDFVNHEPPRIHLTGIKLFFDPIENTSYWNEPKTKKWFSIPDSLELPYTKNHLRFEFTGIDLKNPEGVRFRWMLIGFDKNWTPENTERLATYSNLPPGEYTFTVQAKNADGFWSEVEKFSFHITPPIWATWPFRIIAGSIIFLLIILVFLWGVRLTKRKTKQQLEKITLEKHVLELEQKALRLQMNPHFIFNALQSIQGFIARNDSSEARRYLAKFGKLMRLTLENSRQSYTSVAQEAESLEYYLNLEAVCHGNRFTYSIETDERINPEATFIPVMLIQPFVENAVIHGMKHLGENIGKIQIRFLLDENSVLCEIEDNGVGRKKAAEFESETKKDHKSAALEITRERLQQVNEVGKPESKLEIIDLHNSDGSASGTKVVIRIGNVVFE